MVYMYLGSQLVFFFFLQCYHYVVVLFIILDSENIKILIELVDFVPYTINNTKLKFIVHFIGKKKLLIE